MNQTDIAQRAAEKFKTPEGSIVDVLYATSDGSLYYSPEEASNFAGRLENKVITPYYRDSVVREMAKQFKDLQNMVFATDYVKASKIRKVMPLFKDYNAYCKAASTDAIPEDIFNFVVSKVFQSKRPTSVGLRDKIYMYNRGIVDAIFLRRYAQGQVWQVGDTLVFTCPTNTELMSGTYQTIFSPLFAPATSA